MTTGRAITVMGCLAFACSTSDGDATGTGGSADAGAATEGGRDNGAQTRGTLDAGENTTRSPSTGSGGATSADASADSDTGTGGRAAPGAVMVYVTDAQSSLQVWSVDDDNAAITLQQTYDTGPGASQLALHPDGLHLYATATQGNAGNRVIAFAVDPTDGTLTELGVTSLELSPVYFAIGRSGNFAFSASYSGDEIGVWGLEPDFTVSPGVIATVPTDDEPHAIVPHPQGPWVYVPHRTGNTIWQLEVDPRTGSMTQVEVVNAAPGAGARHLVFDSNGEHAYLADEFSDTVTHFVVDGASGALAMAESVSTIPRGFDGRANTCADVHITRDDRTVYVSNRGHDSLAMFSVDATTGSLAAMGTIPTEATPREFDVDPTGRFVYSAGQSSGALAGYTIDPGSGALTAQGVAAVGGSPAWVLSLELPSAG